MKALVIAIVLLAGCPPQPKPTQLDLSPSASCVGNAVSANVCYGAFTSVGYACVRCPDAHGCVDGTAGVYCVATDCSDPACSLQ